MKTPDTRGRRPTARHTGCDSALVGLLTIMVTCALVDGLLQLAAPLGA